MTQLYFLQAVAGSEYAYIIYGMNDVVGSYNLKHTNPLTTFGVLVYGQIQLEAYGYTGGSRYTINTQYTLLVTCMFLTVFDKLLRQINVATMETIKR